MIDNVDIVTMAHHSLNSQEHESQFGLGTIVRRFSLVEYIGKRQPKLQNGVRVGRQVVSFRNKLWLIAITLLLNHWG